LKKRKEAPLKIGVLKLSHLNMIPQAMMIMMNLKCMWRSIGASLKRLMVTLRWRM
jgi:hypothetical protein